MASILHRLTCLKGNYLHGGQQNGPWSLHRERPSLTSDPPGLWMTMALFSSDSNHTSLFIYPHPRLSPSLPPDLAELFLDHILPSPSPDCPPSCAHIDRT